ncbi:hypothetical protein M9H77_11612 [Catharanthus roseus]|uniref:Uncharacterized protein n=1 Tax=Catharanthus roseus TaxID=4058 RepID=A0ACC0BF55_CATRO|nr:hypothetical protein M9H77_11612 [Catharanthus roseus]
MANLITITFVFCVAAILTLPFGHGDPESVEKWFEKLPHTREKLTQIHFYLHDVVSGNNPTAVQVAHRNVTPALPTTFGSLVVIDDPLTVGPKPDSEFIGRAQGIYSSASQGEVGLLMAITYVFTNGKYYNGSTLSVLAHNPILHKSREMPIVGGTGVFRLARGIATAKTYFFNTTSLDAVVEYNLVVMHY